MPLTQQQYDVLRISNSLVNSISIAGSLFVIGVYIFGISLRNYPLKLVCYMAVSNTLLSIAYISSIEEALKGKLCTLQGFMINLAQLSSLVWTMIFSYCLLRSIQQRNNEEQSIKPLESYEWQFLAIGYIVPSLLSIIPFFGGIYTSTQYYCWISFNNQIFNIIEQMIQFYLPLIAALVFNLYTTIRIRQFQKQHQSANQSQLKYLGRLYIYPIIIIVCWSPKLLTRALLFGGIEMFWLQAIDVVLGGLVGLANSIAYGTNQAVIRKIRSIECCPREEGSDRLQTLHRTIELTQNQQPYRTKSKSYNQIGDNYVNLSKLVDPTQRKYSTEV